MKVPIADLQAQHRALENELTQAFKSVISAGSFGLGENVAALEAEIAAMSGFAYARGLNSGTDALLLALLGLGIGPGDEVITTPFTFVATVETICLAGASPVFADIDPRTFNMDPEKAAAKITSRTKAIMPVHLFGQLADMDRFNAIAAEHGIPVIEDAAQAIGAAYNGQPMGARGQIATLSFFPTKNLGACGDGGMILTNSADLAEQVRLLRFHGSGGGYIYKEIGYCSRLDELQAAILRVKAPHLGDWNNGRRRNASEYDRLLADLGDHVATPFTAPGNHHVYHQYTMRVKNGRRDALKEFLATQGIQTGIYYPLALHMQEAYAHLGAAGNGLPESVRATEEVLSLPVHPDLTIDQVRYVGEQIHAFFG
jgi:dTDP-4-amino-4,6-dideoxygalactose transaminase